MAVIWNSLTFGSVNSLDYGIFVTGDAVYNAPERAVERVSVAGRNGDLLIDQGHWNNIEVSYPCGTFAETASDFSRKIAAFRNAVVSQLGYQRLSDTYNDSEYRMADASAGFDVTPTLGKAGEFTLTFNCKPQRWLASGEATITVADGETLVNPTLYDAHPLLAVEGYGTIGFNGYEITIDNATLGRAQLALDTRWTSTEAMSTGRYVLDMSGMQSGDTFSFNVNRSDVFELFMLYYATGMTLNSETVSGSTNWNIQGGNRRDVLLKQDTTHTFTYGTASSLARMESDVTLTYATATTGTTATTNITITTAVSYDGDKTISLGFFANFDANVFTGYSGDGNGRHSMESWMRNIYGVSTQPVLGHPTYIDCDLGEAYKYEDGSLISLNRYIALGSDLPCLAKGGNLITADSTITELKITPRWWIL